MYIEWMKTLDLIQKDNPRVDLIQKKVRLKGMLTVLPFPHSGKSLSVIR